MYTILSNDELFFESDPLLQRVAPYGLRTKVERDSIFSYVWLDDTVEMESTHNAHLMPEMIHVPTMLSS